jgi:hypothetical protein
VFVLWNNANQIPRFKKRAREILKAGRIDDEAEVDNLVTRLNGVMAGPEGKHLSKRLLELKDKGAS